MDTFVIKELAHRKAAESALEHGNTATLTASKQLHYTEADAHATLALYYLHRSQEANAA